MLLKNSFEGGTDGVAISAANSGGSSGDAFTEILAGTGAPLYTNVHPLGSLAYRIVDTTTVSLVGWNPGLGSFTTSIWMRSYVYLPANPTTVPLKLFQVRTSGATSSAFIAVNTTTGFVSGWNAATVEVLTGAVAVPLGQWFRLEARILSSTTAGEIEWRLFSDPDSTTAAEIKASPSNLVLGANSDGVRFGITGSVPTAPFSVYWDNAAASSSDWLGPELVAASTVLDFTRNPFPFMPFGRRIVRGQGIGQALQSRTSDLIEPTGPTPYGGFERFTFTRMHPVFGGTVFAQALDATVTATATLTKQINKLMTATAITSTATFTRQVGKTLSASSSSSASLVKQVGKTLSASVTSSASLLAQKVKTLVMTATTVTSTATLIKQVNKSLTATVVTSTTTIGKQVNKLLSATVTSTATMTALKVILKTLTATTVNASATMVRQVGKPLTATVSATATLVKQVNKKLTATTVTAAATMLAQKVILKALTATTVTSTATMVRQVRPVLTASVTSAASITKRVSKGLTANVVTTAILDTVLSVFGAVQNIFRFSAPGPIDEMTSAPSESRYDAGGSAGSTTTGPSEGRYDPPEPH